MVVDAIKKANAIDTVVKKMIGKRELDTDIRKMVINSLASYDNLKITAGKPHLNRKFYAHFLEEHKLNDSIKPKKEKQLHSFFSKLAKYGIIHKNSSMFKKGLSVISLNKNPVSLHQVSLNHVDNYNTVVNKHCLFQMQPLQASERIRVKFSEKPSSMLLI